jgi:biopolymer transport protein ExbB
VVKPLLLAGGVSKAMVTTAGGLIVAIPAMLFYSYFRGKVQEISHVIESYSTEIIRIIEEE